jgi:hypothetical protein
VGAENSVTSCDLHILVDEAAEPIPSQWPNCRAGAWGSAAGGRLLMQRSVRAVSVEMVDVLAQHCGEVTRSGDQELVEAFAPQGADEAFPMAFARGARTGVRMMRMSAPANTASKAAVNLVSRSRIKKRN